MPRDAHPSAGESGGASIGYAVIAGLMALMSVAGVTLADAIFDAGAGRIAGERDRASDAVAARTTDGGILTGSIRRRGGF